MDTYYEHVINRLRRPRVPKEDEWSDFSHRKIKVENPRWTGHGSGCPQFINKWLIEFNGKPIVIKDTLEAVNKFYGKGTARS